MAIPRLVNLSEPGDIETLHMYVKTGGSISIAVCPDDIGLISMLCRDKNGFAHMIMTEKETKLIIDVLTKTLHKITGKGIVFLSDEVSDKPENRSYSK